MILGGILLEIVLLFSYPHSASSLELWLFVLANAAIGVGLAVENVCILRAIKVNGELKRESDEKMAEANARAAEANQKAAEANDRAAKANLETEKLRQGLAWRSLTGEQKARITASMVRFSGQRFAVITYRTDDPESSNLGAMIQEALVAANWAYSSSEPLDWLDTGISVEIGRAREAEFGPIAAELVRTLNAEGIATKQVHDPKYDANPTVIFVVVGKKPPSGVELPGRGLALEKE